MPWWDTTWRMKDRDTLLCLFNIIYNQKLTEQKGCIHLFPNRGNLTVIAAKVYNAFHSSCIWSEVEKVLLKNQNGFGRKWSYSKKAETIADADNADGLELLANIPSQAKSLLHSLEKVNKCISLYVIPDKRGIVCLNPHGTIPSLNSKYLKLVDHFTRLGSNISSTESDVNIHTGKA